MITRVGMAVLGVLHLVGGAWALIGPRHFFDTFPGFGERWTAAYPPYNEHLVADLGATFVTLGVLLLAASVLGDRRVTIMVLAGVTVFSAIQLAFHAGHHGSLAGVSLIASLISLAFGVLVPILLLLTLRRA